MKFSFLLLCLLVAFVDYAQSSCRLRKDGSFSVFCDELSDPLDYHKSENWTEIVYGSRDSTPGTYKTFNRDFLDYNFNVEHMTIVNRLNDVDVVKSTRYDPNKIHRNPNYPNLKYLSFFGNAIGHFDLKNFILFPNVKILNFDSNQIDHFVIVPGPFGGIDFNILRVSNNRITGIAPNTFRPFKIKEIDLSHNRLTEIERNSLPYNLEVLRLDHNRLGYLKKEIFDDLDNLQEITASHNRLSFIWDLASTPIKNALRILDLSRNEITRMYDFSTFKNLSYLDLSHNQIESTNLVEFPQENYPRSVSLAFNRLKGHFYNNEIKFPRNLTLILFGNPWRCDCLFEFEKSLKEKGVKRGKCDLSLFGGGQIPQCVNVQLTYCTNVFPNNTYFDKYLDAVEENKNRLKCDPNIDLLNGKLLLE